MNMPINGMTDGTSSAIIAAVTMGNSIFSCRETGRSWRIRILRSAGVVIHFMMAGWISGTMAM